MGMVSGGKASTSTWTRGRVTSSQLPPERPRGALPNNERIMSRERWMALCFVAGSACFLIGPFPGYASLVGDAADSVTFFVGSVLFTAGGALQIWIAFPERHLHGAGRAAWWAAGVP